VDHFLCIGAANRELYRSYGVPESKLHMTPYAVDNERFARQAEALRNSKSAIRNQWRIPEDAYVVLFCGKFIPKKRPLDLIKAAQLLLKSHPELKTHLLFAGSGELGRELRANCNVVFDSEAPSSQLPTPGFEKPRASFAGFLNQTEISKAYVAVDVLVLPSDYGETWGLVVNEAMASGLRSVISNRCGCAVDLGSKEGNTVFEFADTTDLASRIEWISQATPMPIGKPPSLLETVTMVHSIYQAAK
jgi:glycosyltransferase involved in cell wall biosynthesis